MSDSPSVNEAKRCIRMQKKKEDGTLGLTPESADSTDMDDEDEMEIRCGAGGWRPSWLQMFAKAEIYTIAYTMLSIVIVADASYFVGTLSTVEKYFKFSSRTTGFMASSFEIGTLLAMPVMGYAARHLNPMRLVFCGITLTGITCMCFALPHFIIGAGGGEINLLRRGTANAAGYIQFSNETLTNTSSEAPLEVTPSNCDGHGESFSWPAMIFCILNLLVGIGTAAHHTVGFAYIDNNASKNKSPILLAVSSCVSSLGAMIGYAVSAAALSTYVEPMLTPTIDKNDPRWVGAWWIGWPLMGALTVGVGCVIGLFPRRLPQVALKQRQVRCEEARAETLSKGTSQLSAQDLKCTIWRLLKNKILVFNTCSTICLMFGYSSYWTFLPKYIEIQFQKLAAEANLITGSVNMVFTGAGIMAAAVFITRFKPRPQRIAFWNVLTEVTDVLGHFFLAFLGCSTHEVYDTADSSGIYRASCNSSIVCGSNPLIQPICSREIDTTFYSPCFAGCSVYDNETKIFSDCACLPNGIAENGPCHIDCTTKFMTFIIIKCTLNFLQASGHSGNMLLAFRCLDEKDKPLSIALTQIVLSVLVFFPAPAFYGAILDSTCLFWEESCAGVGNCLFYDKVKMRYILNFIATGFLIVGVAFDIAVWKHSSELNMYDEDDSKDPHHSSEEKTFEIEDGGEQNKP